MKNLDYYEPELYHYGKSASIGLITPMLLIAVYQVASGAFNPIEFAKYVMKPAHERKVTAVTTEFLIFTAQYFGSLVVFLGFLVNYNLLKMFGLDKVIQNV